MKDNKTRLVFLMLLPMAVIMIGLVFYPIAVTFGYSLHQMKLTNPSADEFIGLENYISILKDPDFWYSFWNSFIILIVVVVISGIIGIAVALLLNIDTPVKGLLMAIAIIPWALPPIVNGVMWRWIFHPSYGFLNKVLLGIGAIEQPIQWLSGRFNIILITSLVTAWRNIPFCAVVLLAAMQSIPQQLYEAATIDGSSKVKMFWMITFPLIVPSLVVVLTSTSITAINVFDEIVSLSGYGDVSKTLMINSYLHTFSFLDFGLGSAMTYIILIIAGVLGLVYIKNVYKEVDY